MAQNFQSSFIPKGSLTEMEPKKQKTSLAGLLMVSLFVLTIVLSAGLFVYKKILNKDIQNLKLELAEAGKTIDKESIQSLIDFSSKMNIARSIALKHQVVSGFLDSLASSTVRTVHFEDFTFDNATVGSLVVNMTGQADSYSSVALQESVFSNNKHWNAVTVSDLSLSDEGFVGFRVSVSVDPATALYSAYMPVVEIPEESLDMSSSEISDLAEGLEGLDTLEDLDDFNI